MMKHTLLIGGVSLVAGVLLLAQGTPSAAQAQTMDAQRTQALGHTAFPKVMTTYQNCLGDQLADGITGAESQASCQTLAVHEVQQRQGQGAVAAFLAEITPGR